MDTTLSPPTGQLLDGRYQVDSRLAHGGMATVYLGRDIRLDRIVALKIAHQELASDQEFVRRFITEARAVAQLSSPNVVAVYDQGSAGDVHYIVMEYVAGPTLRDVLNARGSLSVRESLDVIEGVLAGLAAAHRTGIIHRDVKPENVLLGTDGAVKVADFGLARAAAAVARTKTGMIIGTAAYLAPEQVSSSASDARTDVYAAGVLLFEMLTGAQPHTGESPLVVAYKHVNDVVPPPSSLVAGLPPALDALVALATSRDPDLRPPDAGQFLYAISEVRRGAPLSSTRRGQHAAPAGPQAGDAARTGPAGRAGPAAPGGPGGSGTPDESLEDTDLGPAISAALTGSAAGSPAAGLGFAGSAAAGTAVTASGTHDGNSVTSLTSLTSGRNGSSGANALAAPHATGSGRASIGPDATGDLVPLAGAQRRGSHGQANHTLIVSPGSIVPGFGNAGDDNRGRRARGYRPDHEPPLQRLLFSRRVIYVLGALAVVLLAVLLTWWLTAGQDTQVPQVSGWSAGLARTELTGIGFKVHNGPGKHSDEARGRVISTSPKAGAKIKSGATITLTLSLGPVKIQVPPVTGDQLQQAQQQLQQAGLTTGTPKQTPSTTIPAGIVISTNPVAGTAWPKNKPVGITVSTGPPLPNFVGGQLAAAQQAAQAGGYQVNPVQDASSDQPSGTVTKQSPAAGTAIHSGEVVTVYVSAGPPQVGVPDVRGMTTEQAKQALQQAGFNVSVNKVGHGNHVFSYGPQGQAPAGSTITINVGFGFF